MKSKKLPMPDKESFEAKIKKFMKKFSECTKEEADYVESILKWDGKTRSAFIFAKRMFEEKE